MNDFAIKIIGVFTVIVFILLIFIGVDFMELDSLRKANEQLKKEKYECKQELDKYKEKYLNIVVNN